MKQTLEFIWTVSRGRETYGYNICSLYSNGVKVSSCNGGGYDMQGVCLANYLNKLNIIHENGACGIDYIIRTAEATGKVDFEELYLPKHQTKIIIMRTLDK